MLPDSVGQEFRQSTAGMACFCCMMSGVSAEKTQSAEGWVTWKLLYSYAWYLDWGDSEDGFNWTS